MARAPQLHRCQRVHVQLCAYHRQFSGPSPSMPSVITFKTSFVMCFNYHNDSRASLTLQTLSDSITRAITIIYFRKKLTTLCSTTTFPALNSSANWRHDLGAAPLVAPRVEAQRCRSTRVTPNDSYRDGYFLCRVLFRN